MDEATLRQEIEEETTRLVAAGAPTWSPEAIETRKWDRLIANAKAKGEGLIGPDGQQLVHPRARSRSGDHGDARLGRQLNGRGCAPRSATRRVWRKKPSPNEQRTA
jgi:hypothetical protein